MSESQMVLLVSSLCKTVLNGVKLTDAIEHTRTQPKKIKDEMSQDENPAK